MAPGETAEPTETAKSLSVGYCPQLSSKVKLSKSKIARTGLSFQANPHVVYFFLATDIVRG
jgi:hypothetical protein